jgi:hypothetical protein
MIWNKNCQWTLKYPRLVTTPKKGDELTHQTDYTFASDLAEKGLEVVPELMRILTNNVIQVERSRYLQANECERTEERTGHANPAR